jgi:hypothetical protein
LLEGPKGANQNVVISAPQRDPAALDRERLAVEDDRDLLGLALVGRPPAQLGGAIAVLAANQP